MALEIDLDEDEELTDEMVQQLEWAEAYEVASDLDGHLPHPADVLWALKQIYWEAEDELELDQEHGIADGTVKSYLASRYDEIDEALDLYNLVNVDLESMTLEQLDHWVAIARPVARAGAERAGAIPLANVLVE